MYLEGPANMTVTFQDQVWFDEQTVEVFWASSISGATFYIYRDREFVTSTGAGSYQFRVVPGEYLLIDVFDSSSDEPEYAAPGRVNLCWFEVSGSVSYLIQEKVGAYWQDRESVLDNGEGFFRYLTRYLEDASTTEFRVFPIDAADNRADATVFTVVQVRHPEIPEVGYTYDSATGKVTIDTKAVTEARDEDMPAEAKTFEKNGSSAMAETLSAASKRKILEIRVTLTPGSDADLSDFTVKLGPPGGQTLDSTIYAANETQATALASSDGFIHRFKQPVQIADDQDVDFAWPNADSDTWELQVAYIDTID